VNQSLFKQILKLIRFVLLSNTVLAGLIAVVGYFRRWETGFQYGEGFSFGGFAIIGVGVLSLIGFWSSTRDFSYQYSQSAGNQSILDRSVQLSSEVLQKFSFQIDTILSGALAIVIGAILQTCF